MCITSKHIYGWNKEVELMPRLQELFGESLIKTTDRFNKHDWTTENYLIDLKTRLPPTTENTYDTWDTPVCKFLESTDKEIICFYYFEQSDNLFYIIYDAELFATYKRVPNRNGQLTFKIPRQDWTQV